ncbi:ectoine dioxygenase-like isoform X1 [Portunus trituberculatus]|uniref:ectoine dioxygenase-like isoform X1 n=3 Tax=Portunus trituberculatus TaxID=210409 RepID=UPI001E1CBFDA|nr:ectoine dioxygenase-like isoform X1 [Portunus trituberculatus]
MAESEFSYSDGSWRVTEAMKEAYHENGYIIVRNMFNNGEVAKVRAALEDPNGVQQFSFSRSDGKSRDLRFVLWNHPGRDVTGVMARTQRVAGTAEELLGGDEVYHYHTKLIMKDAKTGGNFLWHQDYGYWYKNGCLYPDLLSVFIPMDEAGRHNGCLQVLKGSHRLGRIDHREVGEQLEADPERVAEASKSLQHVYVELKAGDALFFNCNLLHTSAANNSDRRRWVFIVAFNKRSNNPYKDHHHPRYTPLHKVPDAALMECREVDDLADKWFMRNDEDHSVPRNLH